LPTVFRHPPCVLALRSSWLLSAMKSICLALLVTVLVAAPLANAQTPKTRPPLLAAGTIAPDFSANTADGNTVKLSDFRGKAVLIDFWSTWCGPCKMAMPHMEKIHQRFKDQGLVVLGVCVWDVRSKFNAWMKEPEVKTSYLKVFDPAGRNTDRDIAKSLYSVSGIPTFYLVGKDGAILFAGAGAGPNTERALDRALARAGFRE
jgi:thiol-disulfide isomerase/thioredoxin